MNVLVLSGSRNPQGQTAQAIDAFVEGVKAAKSKAETLFLSQMTIERCRQCEENGWGLCRAEGRCVIEDDFAQLVAKIQKADATVFVTPVYFSDLSESISAFLDRLRRVVTHNTGLREVIGRKLSIGICVAGGGGGGAPSCAVSLEKVVSRCGFQIVDMIPVRRQNLKMKLDVLKIIGKWLASLDSHSDELD